MRGLNWKGAQTSRVKSRVAQVGRTGHANYRFKGKVRVDQANILAYNRPQNLTATNGTRPIDGVNGYNSDKFVGEYASDVEVEWRTTRRRRVTCGGGTASVR
ncbi:Putative ycf1 C-terminal part [Gossypium arboreum]|uniref:Putative ycf1 C-terminal part n=1 Tax=Gossypium arboreum TaxID=29729 RepID=A0A0B0NUG6_GOSAR|nr:Putative ycf1 C-terminal part [Gossypium arboreum]